MKKKIISALCTGLCLLSISSINVFAASSSSNIGGKIAYANVVRNSREGNASTTIPGTNGFLEVDVTLISKRGNSTIRTVGRNSNYGSGTYAKAVVNRNTDITMRAESSHIASYNSATWRKSLAE